MNIFQSGLALLLLTGLAVPVHAQYDEADRAGGSAMKQLKLLDHADGGLRYWLAKSAERAELDERQVRLIGNLLKGWRTYTSMECDLIGDVTGGSSASKSVFTSLCENSRYIARIRIVNKVKSCLIRVLRKSEHETLYASTCIELLTPLKTRNDYVG